MDTLLSYLERVELKKDKVSATVIAVNRDAVSGQQTSASVKVAGTVMTIPLDLLSPPLASGDGVGLANAGSVTLADWRLTSVTGSRPSAGYVQFYDEATVGGVHFDPGDFVLGGLLATSPNFYFDYDVGTLYARVGSDIKGSWAADGTITSGAVAGPNVQITATAVNIRQATVNAINLTAADGIRLYSITGGVGTQKVWIKPDGSGWLVGSDKISWTAEGVLSIAGNLSAGTIDIGGADNTSFHVDANGNVWAGAAAYADGPFKVSSGGAITSISGAIGGWTLGATALTAGSGSNTTGLDSGGTNPAFYAGSATPASAPFRVTQGGDVFARNINASGSIRASVFEYNTLSAFAGGFVVAKSAGKIASAYTVGGTLTIETPEAGGWAFASSDIIRIKAAHTAGMGDTWITVTRTGTTNVYTTTYQSGTNSVTYPAGTGCIDYGASGQGYFAVAADDTFGASAAWVLRSHAGAPWTTETTHVYAGTDGKLYAAGGDVVMDVDGITIDIDTVYASPNTIKFVATSLASQLGAYFYSGYGNTIQLKTVARTGTPSISELVAAAPAGNYAQVLLHTGSGSGPTEVTAGIEIISQAPSGSPSERIFYYADLHEFGGDVMYSNSIAAFRNGTTYTGYIFMPLTSPLTSTSWDGDSYSSTGAQTLIDLSNVFGAPAGVKAVLVTVIVRDSASASTQDLGISLGPANSTTMPVHVRCHGRPNDYWETENCIVPCDSNGDIYYRCFASGSGTLDVILQIWGYWI